MAVVWETIKAGDTLFEVKRQKMGNTTMSRTVCYAVKIEEIDHEKGSAMVRWNGNTPRRWHRHQLTKLRRSEPKKKV